MSPTESWFRYSAIGGGTSPESTCIIRAVAKYPAHYVHLLTSCVISPLRPDCSKIDQQSCLDWAKPVNPEKSTMSPTKRRDGSWLAINGFASDGIGCGADGAGCPEKVPPFALLLPR